MTATDWIQLIGLFLTLFTLLAAVVATKFAAESAKAANETVEPMQTMAASLKESVSASEKVLAAMRTLVMRSEATAELSRLNRQADQLVRRIGIYHRVAEAVEHMREGQRRTTAKEWIGSPVDYREAARADLKAALSLLPPNDLQPVRQLANEYQDVFSALMVVDNDLPGRIRVAHEELEALEKQIAEQEERVSSL
jgi:predicted  nucleic acid-binding Zn-ribbon protein